MFFLRLYFAGKEGICKFKKKYSLLRSLWFFENKTVARPAEVAEKKKKFLKMYLMNRNVSVFENHKKGPKILHPNGHA